METLGCMSNIFVSSKYELLENKQLSDTNSKQYLDFECIIFSFTLLFNFIHCFCQWGVSINYHRNALTSILDAKTDSGEKTGAFSVYNREYLNRQLWCTFPFLWFKKKGRRKAFDLGERTKERPFVNIFIPPLHSGKIPKNNLT